MSPARAFESAAVALAVAILTFAPCALAQPGTQQAATAASLRDEAAKAIAAGDYATACPKLEQAAVLDSGALATKLALAKCYEGAGKLQSAREAYLQAETVAAGAGDATLKRTAREHAESLEPRLAKIVLAVPDEVKRLPGLSIQCDGVELGPGLWGVPLPVDKGRHDCTVTAAGVRRVDAVSVDDGKTATLSLRAPATVAAPVPRPVAPEGTFVHILSDDPSPPLTLYRVELDISGTTYTLPMRVRDEHGVASSSEVADISVALERSVCRAPCDQEISGTQSHEFFLGGEGITPSSRFRLDRPPGRVNINASPGSAGRTTGGTVLLTIGTLSLLVGTVIFPIAVSRSDAGSTEAGGVLLGVGAASIAGGIALLVAGKTRYSFAAPDAALRF